MKEKVKIWSRRRLLGAFLAFLGLSAVATAQNGTPNANCSMTPVQTITRTTQQINDSTYGTVVKLNFGAALSGYKVFVVAKENGSLTSMNGACSGLGENLILLGATPEDYDPLSTYTFDYETPTTALGVDNAVTTVAADGSARINIKSTTAIPTGSYYFGVFLLDPTSGCFSDVQVVEIQVITNIYATLTLRNAGTVETPNYVPNEYICSGTTTVTNIGFTLCNLPATLDAGTGRLTYTAKATNNAVTSAIIKGSKVWADEEATDGHSGYGNYNCNFTQTGTLNGSATPATTDWDGENGESIVSNAVIPNVEGDATHKYLVRLGTQTLTNTVDGTNPGTTVAGTVVYTFENMVYTYYISGRRVDVPVVFDVDNNCGNGNSPTEFTVHVAPDFKVQALAYKEGDRPESVTGGYMDGTGFVTGGAEAPTFCQGLDAYLHTEYSTTEGFITSYTWSQVTPAQQLTITNTTDRAPVTSDLTQLAYQLKVVTLWNDAATNGNYGAGCSAEDVIDITVTEAPRLLVQATNSTFTHAGEVCPGTPINISTQPDPLTGEHGITPTNILNGTIGDGDGFIIEHNGAAFSYTITPSRDDLKVFDTWRATPRTSGNLPVEQDFFDNEDNTNPIEAGTITYTIETIAEGQDGAGTNTCPLVNFDGTALTETTTDGVNTTTTVTNAVKLIYTVSPRPQFILGAN